MGRPKGSKNKKTLEREAAQAALTQAALTQAALVPTAAKPGKVKVLSSSCGYCITGHHRSCEGTYKFSIGTIDTAKCPCYTGGHKERVLQ